MSKKYNYSYVDKKTGLKQKRALLLALVSLLLLAASAVIAVISGGTAGAFLGGFGVVGILFAAWGFVYSIRLLSKGMTAKIVFAGAITNGIMVMAWLTLFLMGVRL